jgi:hypothetical protein
MLTNEYQSKNNSYELLCNVVCRKNTSKPDFHVHLLYRGRNPDKSLKSFPPCYSQSPLQLCPEIYIFQAHATSFIFLQTHATSYVYLQYTVKEKGGKPDRKPYALPYGLKNPYRNLKPENCQNYGQKPQRNCTLMNSASGDIQ